MNNCNLLTHFQATLNRFSKLKISCCNSKALEVLDTLGEDHDLILHQTKDQITKENEAINAEKRHTCNVEDITSSKFKSPGSSSSSCQGCQELKQERASSHPGFVIAFDNIDIHLQRKDMTMSAQNRDVHWVNHKMVINRVTNNHLDNINPKANLLDVPNIKFLPDSKDHNRQRLNYIYLVSRILVNYFEVFAPLKDVCTFHISHKYSKEMAQKSVKVIILNNIN